MLVWVPTSAVCEVEDVMYSSCFSGLICHVHAIHLHTIHVHEVHTIHGRLAIDFTIRYGESFPRSNEQTGYQDLKKAQLCDVT